MGVALLVFLVSLGARLNGIDLYSTTDEGYWMQRSTRFGAALARGDVAATYRAGHPGVTVMWVGLLGMGPAGLTPFLPERLARIDVLERAPTYLQAFSDARRAVAVLASVLVAASVMLSWRLFGQGAALAGGALLVLDPYVIGMTRLLHVDALLAPLMLVSVLAGLVYWTRSRHWPYLALSAATGGLAMLTKAPAALLPLLFGLVCAAELWRARRTGASTRSQVLAQLLVWGLIATGVYVVLFPAMWVDPAGRIQTLIAFVAAVGLEPHNGNFFLGRPVMNDPGPLYYAVALPLRMSPMVALGLALLVLPAPTQEHRAAVRWLLAYVVLFIFMMTVASKKFDRYMLPALMALDLLAGVGLWRLTMLTMEKLRISGARVVVQALALAAVLAAGQVFLLMRVWPYPIAYYSPLSGGPDRARDLIMVGWGEGLEQVADFLNRLPDAEQLSVVTSYNHVMRPRFRGVTLPIAPYLRGAAGLPTPDYIVLYVNGVQRQQTSPEVEIARSNGPPVFIARVNGQDYAWVYEMPRTGPRPAQPDTIEDGGDSEET